MARPPAALGVPGLLWSLEDAWVHWGPWVGLLGLREGIPVSMMAWMDEVSCAHIELSMLWASSVYQVIGRATPRARVSEYLVALWWWSLLCLVSSGWPLCLARAQLPCADTTSVIADKSRQCQSLSSQALVCETARHDV